MKSHCKFLKRMGKRFIISLNLFQVPCTLLVKLAIPTNSCYGDDDDEVGSWFVRFRIIWTTGRSELCQDNQKVCMTFYC